MRGSGAIFSLCLLAIFIVFESRARQWGPVFKEGQLVYSCTGKRVTFPWEFLPTSGERIQFIRWTFYGVFSTETVASFTRDDFLPSPEYSSRVEQIGFAGIALKDVTVRDNGNYSVEISGLGVSGDYFTMQRMAALQVADKVLIEGDLVTLTQMPEAVKVKDTGKWTAALACGKFTHHGVPPFPVYWTTPSGDIIKKSDDFSDGSYILLLANPVRGGNYSCEIPPLFKEEACLSSDHAHKVKAAIVVDETQVRLTLLEAHQADLLRDNADLKTTLVQKTEELNTLKSSLVQKSEELDTLRSSLVQKTEELDAQTSSLVLLTNESANTTELMQARLASLEGEERGSTFIRWGKKTCPADPRTTLVYSGVVGGKHYAHKGSGTNTLCLTATPQYDDTHKPGDTAFLYGADYQDIPGLQDKDIPCSVCHSSRASTIMIPGTHTCPGAWIFQYAGHLVSAYYDHFASEFVCLDGESEGLTDSQANSNGHLFYRVVSKCGSLSCPPFVEDKVITCVVCSK